MENINSRQIHNQKLYYFGFRIEGKVFIEF